MSTHLHANEEFGLKKMNHYSKKKKYDEQPGWVRAQIKAFSGWVNSHLKERTLDEKRLGFELHDGVVLFQLLGTLEGKPLGRYHAKPKLKYHKIENLDFVLRYLRKKGEILVGHDAHALTDDVENLKMMLGLLWILIQRYSVRKKYAKQQESHGLATVMQTSSTSAVKDELLAWAQVACAKSCEMTGVEVLVPKSWGKDFSDGRVLCHLFNSIEQGPLDVSGLKKSEARNNLTNVFEAAEQHLAIPQLLDVDWVLSGTKEKESMQTYVAFFRDRAMNPLKAEEKPLTALQKQCVAGGVHPGYVGETVHYSEYKGESVHPAAVLPLPARAAKPPRQDQLDMLAGLCHPAHVAVDVDTLDQRVLNNKERAELLEWLNSKIKKQGVTAEDFTDSFKDGKVMCALVNHWRPNKFNLDQVGPKTAEKRVGQAFDVCEKDFEIDPHMTPKELTKTPEERKVIDFIRRFRDTEKNRRLLRWVNRRINPHGAEATDFTTSWQKARTLPALVKSFEPGKINLNNVSQPKAVENIDEAMSVSENHMNITRTMSANTMVEAPIEQEVIRYVTEFQKRDDMLKLLKWVNRRIAPFDQQAHNFTTSFQNPKILSAMVLSFLPEAIDLDSVSQEHAVSDIKRAMNIGEREIAVVPIMSPVDMADHPDEESCMAYMHKFLELAMKLELLAWLNEHTMPQGVAAEDFSQSFQDPQLMAALTDAFVPEAIPVDSVSPETAVEDIMKAMEICDDQLDIQPQVGPEEMVAGANEDSVAAYVSDFRSRERILDLLEWLNGRVDRYDQCATNFTTSFTDPKILCGLVKSFEEEEVDLDAVTPETATKDVDAAMGVAQEKMNILRAMTAHSLLNYPDEDTTYEYVALFREYERKQALLKWLNKRLKQYNLHAENFTSSFENPLIFSGLVKSFEPNKITIDPAPEDDKQAHDLVDRSMGIGEKDCRIPRRMGATVMLDGPDGDSMYEYVADFRQLERKRDLLRWVNKRILPFHRQVRDFGNGWKEPKILGALVASFEPDELDVEAMADSGSEQCLDDLDKAMTIAEQNIGVESTASSITAFTQLMAPEHQDLDFPDSEAIFNYISEFRERETKEALLAWLNGEIGQFGVEAEDLELSFQDPMIINALVKAFMYDDIDLDQVAASDPVEAVDKAMAVAEAKLNIERRIGARTMVEDPEDDKIAEYVSDFRDKQRLMDLLRWLNTKLRPQGLYANDFSDSFKNPKIQCALVEAFQPKTFDLEQVHEKNGEESVDKAFNVAKDTMQIHPVMTASRMLRGAPEMQVADYVTQYREYERRRELLAWLNKKISPFALHADDFTKSFQDPHICCGLVKAFESSDVDLDKVSEATAVQDVNDAMDVAVTKIGIAPTISPYDMINKPKEKDTMSYVARFREEEQMQDLLHWLNGRLAPYGLRAVDLEESFCHPAILNGLVKSFEEDDIDLEKVSAETAVDDVQHAMDVGEKKVGVKPTLTAERMVEAPDVVNVCKYVQAFRDAAREREMLKWVNSRINQYDLTALDFSDSFRDPKIVNGLVKSFEPDDIKLNKVGPKTAEKNVKEAFSVALDKLKVPPTVAAKEMVKGAESRLVLDYCAELRRAARLRALLAWLNQRTEPLGVHADDFGDSFKDPKVVGALVKSFVKLDIDSMGPETAAADIDAAEGVAEENLGIPASIPGVAMANYPNADAIADYVQDFKDYERRQRLLAWVNHKIKPFDLHADDLQDSWKDPKIINGLIKSFVPDSINLDEVSEPSAEGDIDNAMSVGENEIGVGRTMTAAKMHGQPEEDKVAAYCEALRRKVKDQALLDWVNNKIEKFGRAADDFSDSFTDNRTIAALVKAVEPTGAVDLLLTMKQETRDDNRRKKIQDVQAIADKKLNVPPTVSPAEMADGSEPQKVMDYCQALRDVEEDQLLLTWLNERLQSQGQKPVKDFDKSFKEPKVLCALVNSFSPEDPSSNLDNVSAKTAVKDIKKAMDHAWSQLDVRPTMSPEAMADGVGGKAAGKEYVNRFRDAWEPDRFRDTNDEDEDEDDESGRFEGAFDDEDDSLYLAKDNELGKLDDKELGLFQPSGQDDPYMTKENCHYFGQQPNTVNPGAFRDPIPDDPVDEEPLTDLQWAAVRGEVHPASIVDETAPDDYNPLLNHPGSIPYDMDKIMANYLESIRPPPDLQVLREMINGDDFNNYEEDEKGNPERTELLLFFEPDFSDGPRKGMVCWNYDKKRDVVPGQTMDVHHIEELFAGKQTDPLKGPLADGVPDEVCLAVVGYVNRLDLEAQDEETAERWLEGLAYLMRAPKEETLAMIAATEPKPEPWCLDINDPQIRQLLEGRNWTCYSYDAEEKPIREDVFVFLTPEGGRLGSFHVCEAARRTTMWGNHKKYVRLHRLTDVKGGKYGAIWKTDLARPAHGSRCLSIMARKGGPLYLEGQSKEQLLVWVNALNYIAMKSGRKVEKADPSSSEVTDNPIYKATEKGTSLELYSALAELGASVKKDVLNVCLLRAVVDSNVDKTIVLIHNGASVHHIDAGQTPLHRAMMWADMTEALEISPIIRLLVSAGARQDAQDVDGNIPASYAEEHTLKSLKDAFEEERSFEEVAKELVSNESLLSEPSQ